MSCNCPTCNTPVNPGNDCPNSIPVFQYGYIVINDNLIIPEQKPDVEFIANVTRNFQINDVEVLNVNLGKSEGAKVIISGTLFLGVEYSAACPSQELHFAHFCIPFKAMIKNHPSHSYCGNRGLLPPSLDVNDYKYHICVAHEQYHVVNPRELSKVLVVLIWLELII